MKITRFGGVSPVVAAVSLAIVSTILGSAMQVMVKFATEDVHPFEAAFIRAIFGVLLFVPVVMRQGIGALRTSRIGLLAARGLIHSGSMMLNFLALSLVPLATVAALRFSAPLWATLLAVFFLHEVIRGCRISALVAGFIGTLIVLRPGFVEVHPGTLAALVSAAAWGVVMVEIKILSKTESGVAITFYGMLFIVPLSGLASIFVWETPSLAMLGWILAMSVVGNVANLFMVASFKRADVAVLMPVQFTTMIWVSLFGFIFFDEVADLWTWVGAAIIFASTAYITLRERKVKGITGKPAPGSMGMG